MLSTELEIALGKESRNKNDFRQIRPPLLDDEDEEERDFKPPYLKHHVCEVMAKGTLVANADSCRNYYRCENSTVVEEECPEGYAFDEEEQKCDLEDEVICRFCTYSSKSSLIADPMNCNFFYFCNKGVRLQYSCPNGERFDTKTGYCKAIAQVHCNVDYVCRQANSTATNFVVADLNHCQK